MTLQMDLELALLYLYITGCGRPYHSSVRIRHACDGKQELALYEGENTFKGLTEEITSLVNDLIEGCR